MKKEEQTTGGGVKERRERTIENKNLFSEKQNQEEKNLLFNRWCCT